MKNSEKILEIKKWIDYLTETIEEANKKTEEGERYSYPEAYGYLSCGAKHAIEQIERILK